MPFASTPVAGTSIYYETHGEGPAVVIVPGGGSNHASWWQTIPQFSDRYQIIAVDWPGYGLSRSDAEQFDVTEWPDSILVALDDAGIDKAVLVAQSLGGMPALLFAVAHPERVAGIVLMSSVGAIRDPEFRDVWLSDRTNADRIPPGERILRHDGADAQKQFLFSAVSSFNQARPSGNIVNHRGDRGASLDELRSLMGQGIQIWGFWGDQDRTRQPSTYELLGRLLPEAHFERLEGASHAFYWEDPEVFNGALEKALSAIYASAPQGA